MSRWQVDGGHDIEQTNLPSGGKDSGYIQMRSQEPWMKVLGLAFPTPAKSQGLESAWPVSELPITRQCGRASLLCVDEVLRPTRRELRQQNIPGRVGGSCSWLLEDMMHALLNNVPPCSSRCFPVELRPLQSLRQGRRQSTTEPAQRSAGCISANPYHVRAETLPQRKRRKSVCPVAAIP